MINLIHKISPIEKAIMPYIKNESASFRVINFDSAEEVAFENNIGKLANKLLKKCTVIGINIFLYFKYKIQFAIPKITAPTTASSICKMPNNIEEITIPTYTSKILDNLLKNTALKSSSSTIGAAITVVIKDINVLVNKSSDALFSEFAVSISIMQNTASINNVAPIDIQIWVKTTFIISFISNFSIKSLIKLPSFLNVTLNL